MRTPFALLAPLTLLSAITFLPPPSLIAQSPNADSNKEESFKQSGANRLIAQLSSKPPAPSLGGTLPTQTDPSKMVAGFFSELKLGRVDVAYDELLRGSKIADVPRDVDTLKAKTREAIDNIGDIVGYDLVKTKPLGSHLLSQTYISAGKNYPIRWRFYFYKPAEVWRIIDIRIDDRLMDMFEEQPANSVPASTP